VKCIAYKQSLIKIFRILCQLTSFNNDKGYQRSVTVNVLHCFLVKAIFVITFFSCVLYHFDK